MREKLVGRVNEIEILDKYIESEKSEFIAVYGRRRVGKTYLIKQTLGDLFDFSFTGMYEESARNQRSQFQKEINIKSGKKRKIPADWFEAFDNLKEYLISLEKNRVVVFLDELPWIDTPRSNFLSAFSLFWNNWNQNDIKLKLVVCGSSTSWMVDKLIGNKGGLYGRITRSIYLSPFTLKETESFLNEVKMMDYGKKQVLDTYMILGGIPYYLDMLDKDLPLSINIDRLLFQENAPLKIEYDFLFRSLFKDNNSYRKVIEALSFKLSGLRREEIIKMTKIQGGELTTVLKDLCSCDFVKSYSLPNRSQRENIYQLIDLYSLFYLRFIKGNTGIDESYWTNLGQSGKKNSWAGYAFEQVCLHHIKQIKYKLGISGILANTFSWSRKPFIDDDNNAYKGGQIDLVIDRADNVINLCEIKYSLDEYLIDNEYEKTVRDRLGLFRATTKTKKDIQCTLITTYGLKRNAYSGIIHNVVTMDDLFII